MAVSRPSKLGIVDDDKIRSLTGGVPPLPTGGTITTIGSDRIHTFTASGTFVLSAPTHVTYLVVGTGGTGGWYYGGGGGGGSVKSASTTLAAGSYTITVGGRHHSLLDRSSKP